MDLISTSLAVNLCRSGPGSRKGVKGSENYPGEKLDFKKTARAKINQML